MRAIISILSLLALLSGFSVAAVAETAATVPVQLTGPMQQGGMVIGRTAPGNAVALDGQALEVSAEGIFVFGFDRDAPSTQMLLITPPQGQPYTQTLTIAARQYAIQRVEGIPQKIMQPSEAALQRIAQDAKAVQQARAQRLARQDFAQRFVWPLIGPVSGVFGSQRVYNGEPGRPHYGVDVAASTGTPVSTPATGKVTLAQPDMFYSGGTLIIDHGHGVSSTLMHLSKVLVAVGDEVKPGDIVGAVGATGKATGPHLDWRMNWRDARIDPQLLVEPMPVVGSKNKPGSKNK